MAQAHSRCNDLHREREKEQKVLYKHQGELNHVAAASSGCSGRSVSNMEMGEMIFCLHSACSSEDS